MRDTRAFFNDGACRKVCLQMLLAAGVQPNVVRAKFLFHCKQYAYFFSQGRIHKRKAGDGFNSFFDFRVMIHKAGNASRNTAAGGRAGDPLKISEIIFYAAIVDPVEADGIKAPGYSAASETFAQGIKLLQTLAQRRHVGFQQRRIGVDGKIKKKIESSLPQLLPDASSQERAEVLRPEHNAVDRLRCRRYKRDLPVIGVDDFEVTPIQPVHKPVQIKGRNIGPSGS